MLTVDDVVGAVGIVPTPATPDAGRWDAVDTIAVDETAKMVKLIVDAGIEMLITGAQFGEVATITERELYTFADCVVRTAAPHPVFIGVTTLNTREAIARAREVTKLGAAGIFAGRPFWTHLDDGQIVQYYRDLTEALPGAPIIVYDNAHAFGGKISLDVWHELAKLPQIVAVRQGGGPDTLACIEACGDRIRFMPNDKAWLPAARKYPDRALACWSGNVGCGPNPIVALSRAMRARDWAAAEAVHADLEWAAETMYPSGKNDDLFADYSIQLTHERIRAAGYVEPGPCRKPYTDVPEEYKAGSQEVGRRYRRLNEKYG
ncbi:MAG: dihydrodipicolinate synthase family protein [Candidatus Lustribacter sp.]|jgi:dihydrodipicolinate synthase/N-acetylneuraminate lyase